MWEVLRDSIWTFIGAIIAIIAIPIGFLIVRKQKRLTYEKEVTELVKVDPRITERLQVLFDGNLVNQLNLVLLRFANSGNSPIDPSDFQNDIELTFGETAQILKAEVTDKQPENIEIELSNDGSKIGLKPTLLNQKDAFALMLLVANYKKISVNGRIKGVKKVKEVTPSEGSTFWLPFIVLGMIMELIGMSLIPSNPTSLELPIVAAIGIILMVVPYIYLSLKRQKQKLRYQKVILR